MSDASISTVDLSRLPAPILIAQLSFEEILAAMVADVRLRLPSFDATLDSDPAMIVLQVAAYRELLLRAAVNDDARQVMVASATGANLDQLGALVGVTRLSATEGDDAFRQRIVLGPEGFAAAGPELAYVYHAKSSAGGVRDASAISPAPGEVLVSVLAHDGDGTASPALLAAVRAAVTDRSVRPVGDLVTVAGAEIRRFVVSATIYTYIGPDSTLVLAASRAGLDAYLADCRLLGRDVTMSGLYAALTVPGVQRVVLAAPVADIVCDATQATYCTGVAIVHGGYDD